MVSTFRVSICGGGMGGLMLALVIGKYGNLPVDIYEAGPTITTVGAGIAFFGRTMNIMKEVGLYEELVKMVVDPSNKVGGPSYRKSDQQDGYHWFSVNVKDGVLVMHRKDMVDLLLQHIPSSCKIHTSKKLTSYDVDSETAKITLRFSDGSRTVTDVLVGADGIHSVTRKIMYQNLAATFQDDYSGKKLLECVDPVWTGMLVYRSLVPTVKLLREYPEVELPTGLMLHVGKKKHIVTFPISQGKLINVIIFLHDSSAFGTPFEGRWVTEVPEQEVLDLFDDWELRCQALVKCVEKPSRWALHSLRPLSHYVNGRVALLGDAAHAMEPHFGAGAGQAIEDAYVLGRLLTHASTHLGNVADALQVYDELRVPFVNSVVQRSRDVGRLYGLCYDPPVDGVSLDRLEGVRKSIEDAWMWQSDSASVWGDAEARWHIKCSKQAKCYYSVSHSKAATEV